MNSIKEMHEWMPLITKIEKVQNLQLEKLYLRAKSTAFGHLEIDLFHGTSDDGVKGIVENGFRMPPKTLPFGQKPGMYGQGIYFATDSSKSARGIYTKGSNKLLLCKVLVGKSLPLKKADNKMNVQRLKDEKCDSIFAPRGSDVHNDEYIIFDARKAYVEYIIHYNKSGIPGMTIVTNASLGATKPFERIRIEPQRQIQPGDVKAKLFHEAQGIFSQLQSQYNSGLRKEIRYVEVVVNDHLERKFEVKKAEFTRRGIRDHEVYAFHATDVGNVDSILRKNLDPNRRVAHGRVHGDGCYFSEFPNFSLKYGNGLILFRILTGKEYNGPAMQIPSGYQSKKVKANLAGHAQQIIITDSDQFVPRFVYHFKQ